jgi:hypothetical protein
LTVNCKNATIASEQIRRLIMGNHKICYGYEKVKGKTPSGGAYAEIFYYNNDHVMCEAREASYCLIYERKRNGRLIQIIHAIL